MPQNNSQSSQQSLSDSLATCGIIMAVLCSRCRHYIFVLRFLLSSYLVFFFFSSPILSRRTFDVYHTSTHGVALVRNAGLKCAARGSLKIQDAKTRQKFAI